MRLDQLHDEQYRRILPTLNGYFEQKDTSLSRLDPRNYRNENYKKMNAIIPVLLRAHQCHPTDSKLLFANAQTLNFYSALLEGLLMFMFQSFSTTVGFGSNMEFLRCMLKTYEYLYTVAKTLPSPELGQRVMSFQNHFMRNWNKVQCESLLFDQVKDLLSHAHDFVAPPLFNLESVIKRDYFKITCDKLRYENLCVELFHLDNGNMAIFKVNTQTLPLYTNEQTHELLLRLTRNIDMGAYQDPLFQIGRTLLFPTIRPMDLRIADESRKSILLETKTGNGVTLALTPYDTLAWSQHWRPFVQSLCAVADSPKAFLSDRNESTFGSPINKDTITSAGTRGLGISLKKSEVRTNLDTGLRKSKPLASEALSISEIESLNMKKLMELNDSTDASTMNSSMKSPVPTNIRHIQEPSNIIEQMSPVIGSRVDDIDSIISDDDGINNEGSLGGSPVFNLSAEFHKPQLTKRKSSSFLNLFKKDKSKSQKNSTDSLAKLSDTKSIHPPESAMSSHASTPSSTSKSSKSSKSSSTLSPSTCKLPSSVKLDTNNVLLDTLVKLSQWRNNSWRFFSSSWLQLQVVNSNQGRYMFVVQDDNSNLKLCIAIGERWTISRTTAQDIQIRFPPTDVVASVAEPVPTLLSVRCPQVDNIANLLKHCKKNEVILTSSNNMSNSATQLTLGSNSSSILSNNVSNMSFSRSSTASNDLSHGWSKPQVLDSSKDCKSLLLLSKIKVRLHKYDQQYGWKMTKVGLLNVYSREYNGSVAGCKFEMDDTESFISSISDLKRIGRTGISAGERLVEFKNQNVADETYKLLGAL